MNIDKVIAELQFNVMANPFEVELAKKIITRFTEIKRGERNIFGGLLIYLLELAEKGEFK